MPYDTPGGAHERADRTNHRGLVNDPAIDRALAGFNLPDRAASRALIATDLQPLLLPQDQLGPASLPALRAIAVDGSPAEVEVLPDFPSARVGYLQVAVAHVDLEQMLAPPTDRFVDPLAIGRATLGYVLKNVFPTAVINFRDGQDQASALREAINNAFQVKCLGDAPNIVSLQEVLLQVWDGSPTSPGSAITLRSCPACGDPTRHTITAAGGTCSKCGEPLYVTDVLQLHLEMTLEGSNLAALGRLMGVIEVLVYLWFVHCFSTLPIYQRTAFVLDGPLSVMGPAADLKRKAEKWLQAVHASTSARGWSVPTLIGLQKTGPLVDHARQLAMMDLLPPRTLVQLPDAYLRRWVVPSPTIKAYGAETDFGRRFIYRTGDGRVHVLGTPRLAGGSVTNDAGSIDLTAYPALRAATDFLDMVGTRLYQDAVIPIALAHNFASLPVGIGSDVLRTHAQQALGVTPAVTPAARPRGF